MINAFINQIKYKGLARVNRYEVIVPFPVAIRMGTAQELANLFCDSVNLPGMTLASTPSRTFGETREMPYEKLYENVQLSFYVDADLALKSAFERWMRLIYDSEGRTFGYYRDYIKDIDVYVTSVNNNTPSYKITLFEAYPKAINTIQLDAAGRDVMKMTITIQYKYFLSYSFLNNRFSQSPFPSTQPYQDQLNVTTGLGFLLNQNYNYGAGTSNSPFDVPRSILRLVQ